ncbi:MAG: ATP-binding cassette domain-containing protein [Ignavibacteria bacterium]|nr:ATP-binding cassette domain-containing protein [Ignavibacteria bacterium]
MTNINLCFSKVTFSYTASQLLVIKNLSVTFQNGWTGIIGANGIGKTTLAKLACGILQPDAGSILMTNHIPLGFYCEQETNVLPEYSNDFFNSGDNYSGRLRSILQIKDDWVYRWDSLSYGERKKLQVAIALWKTPDILVLDEPTNHLDKNTSSVITESLRTYKGTGLIISHNRMLLDELCAYCLFMDAGESTLRRGGITEGLKQSEAEEKSKIREYDNLRENYLNMKNSSARLKQNISSKQKLLSKRHLDKHDHDGKSKVDSARLLGKDKTASRKYKNMLTRVEKAKTELENSYFKKRDIDGFSIPGEMAKCNQLVSLGEGILEFQNGLKMRIPNLTIKHDDRIGITGDNGTGKSTLIKFIYKSLLIQSEKVIYIPQEIENNDVLKIRNKISELNRRDLGMLLTVIYRLGSEPERVLKTERPSPGEIRKILLGLGLLSSPVFIIMDEPTNHMDLPSIVCLENALTEFKGALLLVSHDSSFLDKITAKRWDIVYMGEERKLIER